MLNNLFAIVLGSVAVVLFTFLVIWLINKRWMGWANLALALLFFLARSSVIYYIAPLSNEAIRNDQGTISFIRNSFVALMAWVVVSAAVILVTEVVIPFIHRNFEVVYTPPGQKDKVVQIDRQHKRSA